MSEVGALGDCGLKVYSFPTRSASVHWVTDGHEMLELPMTTPGIMVGLGLSGDCGSKVTSRPSIMSIAVHCVAEGHDTAIGPMLRLTGIGVPGSCGSNVTSPGPPTAVH